MTYIQQIVQTLEIMPAELQQEVADFVAFLAQRHVVIHQPTADDVAAGRFSLLDGSTYLKPTQEQIATARKAGFGVLKGKIHMTADFDEPLEDFKEYM